MMAGCSAKLGLSDRMRKTMELSLAGQPKAGIAKLLGRIPFKHARDHEHLFECLHLAGSRLTNAT